MSATTENPADWQYRGVVDSHCHLDRFSPEERLSILTRAKEAGVIGVVTIGTRLSEAAIQQEMTELDTQELRVWCTIGTHPDHVDEEDVPDPQALAELASRPSIVGIGESGLDYFHGTPEVRALQQDSFRAHIRASRLAGVPLVIHARDADDDVARILSEETEKGGEFSFLLHCFSSGEALARHALALGGYISFSGIATFRNSETVRSIAKTVPLDRILVETDAPFLAPVPHRGKRNEPAFVTNTSSVLAEVHKLNPAEFATRTTQNFQRLFTKAI